MSETLKEECHSIFVFGASGDLAKKKTFPALFELFLADLLPKKTIICGYARSKLEKEDLYSRLSPFLEKIAPNEGSIKDFLSIVEYQSGGYESTEDVNAASTFVANLHGKEQGNVVVENRIFYLALPPSVFIQTASSIKETAFSSSGFNRVIVEKPFGRDTKSAKEMASSLGKIFEEKHLYRIDHYLGKEIVQALIPLRFSNMWLEPLLNHNFVQSVLISFKEDIGTDGRGGYFDKSGIIRDIMQNHLMQVLSLLAMEKPKKLSGAGSSESIRDEKVNILKKIKPWHANQTVLGQFKGYLDDETVPNDSKTPTFAMTVMKIASKRWKNVPFIMSAGKALDERKCEIRIILKKTENSEKADEIVIRIQPDPTIYITSNIKQPGLHQNSVQSNLALNYKENFPDEKIPEAYTKLILDVLHGRQSNFVRTDELLSAWKIVTPLLQEIERGGIQPTEYDFGSTGPDDCEKLLKSHVLF